MKTEFERSPIGLGEAYYTFMHNLCETVIITSWKRVDIQEKNKNNEY